MSLQKPNQPAQDETVSQIDEEIDLHKLFTALWNAKYIIIASTLVCAVLSLVYAIHTPNQYRSTVTLAPVGTNSSSELGSIANKLGGLASFTGLSLGQNTENKVSEALEILQSWGFLENFIKKHNIAPEVFAAKNWDRSTNTLVYDKKAYNPENEKWLESAPSSWMLYQKFRDHMSISKSKETGFIFIHIEHVSPLLAKDWVDALTTDINEHLKERDSKEAIENIEFLKNQIRNTSINEMQTVFHKLIEEQTKTLMLTEGNKEYVLRTINKAKVPEIKSTPNRGLIVIQGAIIGLLLGMLATPILIIYQTKSKKAYQ